MPKETYNAIIFFKPEKNLRPRKYRNVIDNNKFDQFLQQIGAWYVNLYQKKSGQFSHRKYV